ncbi:helix-turn-helix domain-containing protein [Actinacidiphila oryziradicis]|uniref:helix-turn-helix domain-containing protein n=1 Tax=Actinacidiphila oryziradicis TaxID=2571141 RepID=UPI001FE765F5|nr:helix-turn-helix domain-containing protein [Actinacidiphila oryziradicis]
MSVPRSRTSHRAPAPSSRRRGDQSRQTFHQRLRSTEHLLGCDLESGKQRARLHVAVTALDVLRPAGGGPSASAG